MAVAAAAACELCFCARRRDILKLFMMVEEESESAELVTPICILIIFVLRLSHVKDIHECSLLSSRRVLGHLPTTLHVTQGVTLHAKS